MLNEKILNQISDRIDKINAKLKREALQDLNCGQKTKDVLNQLAAHAAREFTPESKMFLDSVYNVLSAETLQTEFFQVAAHAAEFNKQNIQKDIESHFSFEVPDQIDNSYSEKMQEELLPSGVIVLAGGVVSICMESIIPISIAVVIAGIMFIVMKKKGLELGKADRNESEIIDEYLSSVKGALIQWITDVAKYYDNQVADLEGSIRKSEA